MIAELRYAGVLAIKAEGRAATQLVDLCKPYTEKIIIPYKFDKSGADVCYRFIGDYETDLTYGFGDKQLTFVFFKDNTTLEVYL